MYFKLALRALRRLRVRLTRPNDINAYDARVSSQNGEDGILREIFRRIGTTNRFFVEFGVEDGKECNTAYLARRKHWNGVMMEGDSTKFAALDANYRRFPAVRRVHAFITRENIVELFERSAVPEEFDLLSIDIDGNDYWVWEALGRYRPRVTVIEYNATRPPPERWVIRYNPDHRWGLDGYQGASLASLDALGARLGYALLGTDENGVNAFFIRNDLLAAVGFPQRTPEEAYHPTAYGLVPADGPFEVI